ARLERERRNANHFDAETCHELPPEGALGKREGERRKPLQRIGTEQLFTRGRTFGSAHQAKAVPEILSIRQRQTEVGLRIAPEDAGCGTQVGSALSEDVGGEIAQVVAVAYQRGIHAAVEVRAEGSLVQDREVPPQPPHASQRGTARSGRV